MMPKVLVGCPTSDLKSYALERYAEGIKTLDYPNFDILLVDNSKTDDYIKKIKKIGLPVVKGPYNDSARQRIIDSRNIIRQKVLDKGYEYFFSLEQDVVPPKDVIQRLLNHNKKIVSGVYFTYQVDKGIKVGLTPVLRKKVGKDGLVIMSKEEVVQPRLMEVGACGLGCVLIHRDVLEKIKFRFSEDYEGFDDIWFCYDSFNAGFKVFADTSLKCKHLIEGWSWEGVKE
jgi:glycosyltransferase involved in cell wall biosynthesis